METVQWKVEGMDCSNCALTIHKYLQKEGMKNVKVNFATGDVLFDLNGSSSREALAKGIHSLGYSVSQEQGGTVARHKFLSTHSQRFLFCLPFLLVLLLPMLGIHLSLLENPWMLFALTLPVFLVGMSFFGKSAFKSIRNGMPNMNVLIAIGATASFAYSFYGTLAGEAGQYMFYETTATIITLVFLGNYLEEASVRTTQRALKSLVKSQKVMAHMIAFDDKHQESVFTVENSQLHTGDLILIKSGDMVPADCKILWGEGQFNESIITGESLPVYKSAKDKLIGGSLLSDGTVKAQVTAVGENTVLSGILHLVTQAQGEKPPVQQLADRISAIFIPVVLIISLATLGINWAFLHQFTPALMRSIAVLVIACPCAMGLATPAAIAVGLGRAARSGILFRNATSLELFKGIRQVVFDKTGTLTNGEFEITGFSSSLPEEVEFRKAVYSLEKFSNHPIAKCIVKKWKTKDEISWKKIEEIKGMGMSGIDKDGNTWKAGSLNFINATNETTPHNFYVSKNDILIGWIDVSDSIRPEAKTVIDYLHSKNIRTIMLSGDTERNCRKLTDQLGIDQVISGQSPEQKLNVIAGFATDQPTAMIGDGINDAPALAKATIGISMSDASQIALQSSQVVLMNNGLKKLPVALGLGKHTYITIKQNLFWAFAYNIIAIPVAAFGFLSPSFSALAMGLSDVVLAINSVRLFIKKVV